MLIVLRDDAAGIAGFVGQCGAVDGEGHVQRESAGDLVSERALVDDLGEVRVGAGVRGRIGGCDGGRRGGGDGYVGCGVGGVGVYDLGEAYEESFLPAGEGFVEIEIAVDAIS